MASENAKAVAHKVVEMLGKKKKIVLGKIALEKGYAQNTADNPKNITETESYQSIVNPFVAKMVKERERAMVAMAKKDLTKVQYEKLSKVMDDLTKNIQLLSGGKTESVEAKVIILPERENI